MAETTALVAIVLNPKLTSPTGEVRRCPDLKGFYDPVQRRVTPRKALNRYSRCTVLLTRKALILRGWGRDRQRD